MSKPILTIENLRTYFHTDIGVMKAVDDLTIRVFAGQTLGIVGESGSGKSVTSLTIMKLLPPKTAKIEDGSKVMFMGKDLVDIQEKDMRKIRGANISMIFQEPMTSLNPVYTTGNQVMEAILLHQDITEEEAKLERLQVMHEEAQRKLESLTN